MTKYYIKKRDILTSLLCIAVLVSQIFFDLKIPEYMTVITQAINDSAPTSVITRYGVEMLICVGCSVVLSVLCSYLAVVTAASMCATLRSRIFRNVENFSPQDVGHFTIDSLITRCSNDLTQVQNLFVEVLQTMVKLPIISVWAILKISGSEWEWTAATAAGILIVAGISLFIIKITRAGYRKIPVLTDRINHYSMEMMTGMRVVRAYNKEKFQEDKFESASNEMKDVTVMLWNRGAVLPPLTTGASNLLTLTIYWTGISLIAASTGSAHNLTLFSDMIVFSSYATLVIASFMSFASFLQYSGRSFASLARVRELLHYSPTIVKGYYTGDGTEKGTVEFSHVSFSYPDTENRVLTDVSFRVEQGETLAIIGSTGSGKSTLAGLIFRFYETDEGSVRVNGVDVNEYDPKTLYSKLGYVPQNNQLFTGTIEENVNFGATCEHRDKKDIERALNVAQASEFVSAFPDREGHCVSEGAKNLSGGQRQRLAVARAICKDAEICIMDDPFSALDFATDRKLRSSLRENCADTTVIMITQRVGTAMEADNILVLDEGHVVGYGKHEALLKECPLYREIAVMQMAEGTV